MHEVIVLIVTKLSGSLTEAQYKENSNQFRELLWLTLRHTSKLSPVFLKQCTAAVLSHIVFWDCTKISRKSTNTEVADKRRECCCWNQSTMDKRNTEALVHVSWFTQLHNGLRALTERRTDWPVCRDTGKISDSSVVNCALKWLISMVISFSCCSALFFQVFQLKKPNGQTVSKSFFNA